MENAKDRVYDWLKSSLDDNYCASIDNDKTDGLEQLYAIYSKHPDGACGRFHFRNRLEQFLIDAEAGRKLREAQE
jgi:hypothetical protein